MRDSKLERARARPSSRGRATPSKLVVVASEAADAVSAAGGLIFDSVRAGWMVDIFLETLSDERALRILGVSSQAVPDGFEFEPEWPDAVFLAASVHDRHRGVQRLVAASMRRQLTDVAFWGQEVPSDLGNETRMEHRLSTAARAFKPHAMNAVGLTPSTTLVEPFRGGQRTIGRAAQSR